MSTATPAFAVRVSELELVRPSSPTQSKLKYLSNIDDQSGLRNHIPFVHLYPGIGDSIRDPVPVMRGALSRALVQYYPLAGRLRDGKKGKLVVDCCGKGVVFREADAEVSMEKLRAIGGGELRPPIPQWDKFLVDDVWGSDLITDSPLLRLQVTRLKCGGFVLAYTFNHCACDAFGALQFITAVAELSRCTSLLAPSVVPSWSRELLIPRSPPKISYPHPEYDPVATPIDDDFHRLAQLSLFLSRADVTALKTLAGNAPTFDVVAATLWRARTNALNLSGEVRLLFAVDTRRRHRPLLPAAYYGAAVVFPCAAAPAAELRRRPLCFATELVAAAKETTGEDEYRASAVDFIELNDRRGFCGGEGVFVVSDMSRLEFSSVDFGWGAAVYGGPARAGTGAVPGMVTSVVGYKRGDGVEGLLALVSMPQENVEAFEREVRDEVMLGKETTSKAQALTSAL